MKRERAELAAEPPISFDRIHAQLDPQLHSFPSDKTLVVCDLLREEPPQPDEERCVEAVKEELMRRGRSHAGFVRNVTEGQVRTSYPPEVSPVRLESPK